MKGDINGSSSAQQVFSAPLVSQLYYRLRNTQLYLIQAYTIFGFPAAKKEKCFQTIDDDSKVECKMFFEKDDYQFIVFQGPSEGVMAAGSEMPDFTKLKKKVGVESS